MDSEQAERWEIDQDEFGNPLVRHRHPTMTVAAYISKDVDGSRMARCPVCSDQIDVPAAPQANR